MVWAHAYLNKEETNPDVVAQSIDTAIMNILVKTKATEYVGFIQGPDKSFRHKAFKTYKANRKEEAPEWMDKWKNLIYQYLINTWKFEQVNDMEVDDAVAIVCSKEKDWVLAHIDKDLDQIPGKHYNFKKEFHYEVSEHEALMKLYTQYLTGDTTDNIKGVPGIGPAKAVKIFSDNWFEVPCEGCSNPHIIAQPDWVAIIQTYMTHYKDPVIGLIKFAESVLLLTLRKDFDLTYHIQPVPEGVKLLQQPDIQNI